MKLCVVSVIFMLSLFFISECHPTVSEESSSSTQGDSLEQSGLSKHKNEEHLRHKRFIDPLTAFNLASAGFGILTGILSTVGFGMGVEGSNQEKRERAEIKEELKGLDKKLDSLAGDVDSLKILAITGHELARTGHELVRSGHVRLQAISLYGSGVSRLRFFLSYLNNFLFIQTNSSLGPVGRANKWADSVLDLGADGIAQVLHDFHDMVMGNNRLFGHQPVLVILTTTLDKESPSYWTQATEIAEFLISIQVSGYVMWYAALNIKGRHTDVADVKRVAMRRFADQERIMAPMLKITWPAGTYGLPKTSSGCPDAAGVYWHDGYRRHDTENDRPGNLWSSGIHFPASSYWKNDMAQHFCMVTGSGGSGRWPRGNYCIFKKDTACSSMGFSSGHIYWDDEDSSNTNRVSGSLPHGQYGSNTKIYYCCRSDGASSTPIDLPNTSPFYLFRHTSQCQQVRGMKVQEEWFRWDNEDDNNQDSTHGPIPYEISGRSSYYVIHYCYYYL